MTASSSTVALLVLAACVLATYAVVATSPRLERPRFVVVLCAAAVLIATAELVGIFVRPLESYQQVWLGYELRGASARLAAIPHVVVYVVGAWGLWTLRAWARLGAMAYLAYVIASFLIWGVRGYRSEGVAYVMLWQMFVLPFLTFGFMYLQRGAKYFR